MKFLFTLLLYAQGTEIKLLEPIPFANCTAVIIGYEELPKETLYNVKLTSCKPETILKGLRQGDFLALD